MKRKGQWRKLLYGLTGMAALLGMLSGHALAAESMDNMSTGEKTAYTAQVQEESAEEEITATGDVKINATNFPDEVFRNKVAEYDTDNNNILSKAERESVTKIYFDSEVCHSVEGIKFFPMLRELHLACNKLESLDVSQCTRLEKLICEFADFKSIDLSQCTQLTFVNFRETYLEEIDVSGLTVLETLYLNDNRLKRLEVSGMPKLFRLVAQGNHMEQLILADNVELAYLNVSGNWLTQIDLSSCPALQDVDVSKNNLLELSIQNNLNITSLTCGNDGFYRLNIPKNTKLRSLEIVGGNFQSLDLSSYQTLHFLKVNNTRMNEVKVSEVTERLYCQNNQLSGTLDLRHCKSMNILDCSNNQISELLLPENGRFSNIDCSRNELTNLILTNQQRLKKVVCYYNKISTLQISNCDNINYLEISHNKISSFNFGTLPNLTYLDCSYNSLKAFDISKNVKLTTLYYQGNNVLNIDLSHNTKLTTLYTKDTHLLSQKTDQNNNRYFDLNEIPELDVKRILSVKNGNLKGTKVILAEGCDTVELSYDSRLEGKPVDVVLDTIQGNGLEYEIIDGTLYLYYEGEMPNFSDKAGNRAPWYAQRKSINQIKFAYKHTLTNIGDYAFYGCTNLKAVKLTSSIKSVGKHAFDGCSSLEEVFSNVTVTHIGEMAFNNNTSLKKITFYNWMNFPMRIDENAFYGCTGMEEISVCYLSGWMETEFKNQFSNPLASSTQGGVLTYYGKSEADTKNIVLSDGIGVIRDYALLNLRGIETITIPNTVSYIGDYALSGIGCENIVLPSHLQWVGNGAFSNNEGLKEIILPDSVNHVGAFPFDGCTSLKKVVFGSGIQSLGNSAGQESDAKGLFGKENKVGELVFKGACPANIEANLLDGVTATAWYLGGGWTAAQRTNCGGNITWKNVSKIAITKQPETVNVKVGEKVTFHIEASGYEPSYQWEYSFDGGNTWNTPAAKSSKTPDYSFTASEKHINLLARCIVTPFAGGTPITSEAAELIVGSPIVITKQPVKATVVEGEAVNFQITATGDQLSYQWQYSRDNGTTWTNPGATTESARTENYKFTAAPKWDGLKVRCILTDEIGKTLTSNTVSLKVTPLITTQPSDVTVKEGEKAAFQIVLANENWTYQWMFSSNQGTTWKASAAASAKTAKYVVTTNLGHNGWLVKCVLTNEKGKQVESEIVKLAVEEIPLVITTQPSGKTATEGDAVTFKVVATGRNITYQWMSSKDAGKTWTALAAKSATTATYKLTTKLAYNGYMFKCVLTDAKETKLQTNAVKLVVNSAGPVITTQPSALSVEEGKEASFVIAAKGEGLTYQWLASTDGGQKWIVPTAPSAKTEKYSFTAKKAQNDFLVKCVVTDKNGKTVESEAAKLTVKTGELAIITQPKEVKALAGTNASFKVFATGAGLTYQWQVSTDDGKKWITLGAASAKTAEYSFTAKAAQNGYLLKCVVTDGSGKQVESSAAKLTVVTSISEIEIEEIPQDDLPYGDMGIPEEVLE